MNPINGFIIICLIINLTYFLGLLNFLTDYEHEKCDVTYMFEYPQFVKIAHKMDSIYPKYELFAYSEGRFTERARDMHFDGIPILFIPGNAGSHKQVRSLASVALRKAINSRTSFHLDYFTVNLNEEYSGLNGALLYDQLDYVNGSVNRILELYKKRNKPPKSVVLIGHSMGGIIARRLMALQTPKINIFPIVISMAAPLKRAPLILDHYMDEFYKYNKTISNASPTTFISISGGFSDQLIPPILSDLREENSLNVVTNTIPLSWLQANHVQILWCKQTILVINRALFDCVDMKTGQISTNSEYRLNVFKHHLIHHNGRRTRQIYNTTMKFNKGEWIEKTGRKYSLHLKFGVKTTNWYMMPLVDKPKHEAATIVAINLDVVDWVFVCSNQSHKFCEEGTHLTQQSEISPSIKYKRRTIRLNLHELKKGDTYSHVVFRVQPTRDPVLFHVDTYALKDRVVTVDLPKWWSLKQHVMLEETEDSAIHYELILPQLQHVIQSYILYVETIECSTPYQHTTASLIVPWTNENSHSFVTETEIQPLIIRLYNSKPQRDKVDSAFIRLTLEPTCKYRVSIKSSYIGMLGQMARHYSTLLIANVAVVVLMSFRSQLINISEKKECSIFFTAVKEGAKPYYVVTSANLITKLLSSCTVTKYFPVPDWMLLVEDGNDFFLLPLLLYACSVGIVWMLAVIYSISLVTLESTVNKGALKFLAKSVSFTFSWSDNFMSLFHKLPFLVSGFLISLSFSTCGGLALCIGMIFYFLKLTQMSQDYIEQVVWIVIKKYTKNIKIPFFKKKTNKVEPSERESNGVKAGGDCSSSQENSIVSSDENKEIRPDSAGDRLRENNERILTAHSTISFHSTIFFIWVLVTSLNLPSVLTWAHNFQFSKSLQPDPSLIPGLVLSMCALPLWQFDFPRIEKKGYDILGQILIVVAVIGLVYTPITLYRLNYLLVGVIVLITLHQLFAPGIDDNDDDENKEQKYSYDDIKTKMD